MFPSASPARAPRTLALVALLVVAVATLAVHTADAAAAAATGAGRLASRLASARPAAAASASAASSAAHSLTQVDRRFKTQWEWKYYEEAPRTATFPACTSELTGATHAVVSADQWSRIDFQPSGATNPCNDDGGFANEVIGGANVATCEAKCKAGFVNTAAQLDGISKFRCAYEDYDPNSINADGTLSGGPACTALLVDGLAEGQATAQGDSVSFHLALDNGVTAATSPLLITVTCTAPHTPSSASLTIPVDQSQSTDITLTIGNNSGGSCTFTRTSGDPRFTGWTKTINFAGASLTASLSGGSTVLTGSVNNLVLTASTAVVGTLTADVRCANSADEEVGSLAATSFSFANGDTAKVLVYTMPPQLQLGVASITVTCKFTNVVTNDPIYNAFVVLDLVFTLARQSLIVSYNNEVINTNSPTTLTLTASAAVSGPLTVTPTCGAGTLSPTTFVINDGATTATVTFTAPAVKTDVVCTFALTTPSDVRFVGVPVAPLTIAVDVPIAVTIAAANPFINDTNLVNVLFSRSIQGYVTMLPDQALFPGKSVTAGTGSTSVVFQHDSTTAQPGDSTVQVVFTYSSGSVDRRYVGTTATLAPRPIVAASAMTMTPSVATGSAALIAGRQSEMSVTLSYAAFDSLLVTPECKDGDTVVGSFSPSLVSFVDGATVASVNYTAPTSIVASLVCSFIRKSGDYRYYERSGSLAALQVIMPTIALTATVNGTALIGGDSLFVGDTVMLTVAVDPATNSALVLRSISNGVAGVDRTVNSGATTAQLGVLLMEAGNSEWSFAYKSGDDRFTGISSNSLGFSAVLTTLTLSGVTNGSIVNASSPLLINVVASHAVRDEELVVGVSCSGIALVESMRLRVGATQSTVGTTVNLPAATATPTTVSCALSYDRGDVRYSYSSAPSFVVVVPAAEPAAASSSSTGDSGSSTGTGSATSTGGDSEGASSSSGKKGCDDVECAASVQANSCFAFLALAVAMAFAIRH